jgi:hypothetical protein
MAYPAAVPAEEEVETLPEQQEVDPIEIAREEAAKAEMDKAVEDALIQLLKDARDEDRFIRDYQLITWKRLEYYWNNILDIFLDPVSNDWRVPNWAELEEEGEVAPRLINIYRPHGESIVAALSVAVPTCIFHPDDPDNPDDVEASKAYRSIVEMLQMHNKAPMLLIRALTIMFNQGTIFAYNYYHKDPKYGTFSKPTVELKDLELFEAYCPECGSPLDGGLMGNQEQSYSCSECGYEGPAEVNPTSEKLPQIVGFDHTPKGTIKQDLYSPLNVKIPAFVRDQPSCGYLLLEFAQSVGLLRSIFRSVAEKIDSKYDQTWESFAKLPLIYLGQMPQNAANVSCLWLRPFQFWQYDISKKEVILELEKRFPDGCYAIFINDEFIEAIAENMDEHWTISDNPLGEFIHARPLGENLATIQDIRAELVEIEVQTAEHGIPETFADGAVLDFSRYGEGRSKPGMITQVKPKAGKSISDAFYSSKPAILSQEISPLKQQMDQDAQFITGDFPSVYGGPATGGSKTAAEYTKSSAVALQRLGNYWKILCAFWTNLQSRSAVEYANVVKELNQDVNYSKKVGDNFINVWIRASSLTGKIGRVEPEASEQLPSSWAQKQEMIIKLLTLGVPEILSVLTHPMNAGMMKMATGLNDIYVPGEDDRIRQFKEFQMMSQGVPVPINELVDNHEVHLQVLQAILEGQQGEVLEDQARAICLQHFNEHLMVLSQKAEQEAGAAPEGEKDNGGRTQGN